MTRHPLSNRDPLALRDYLLSEARSVRAPRGARERTLRRLAGATVGVSASLGAASALGASAVQAGPWLLGKGVLIGLSASLVAIGAGDRLLRSEAPAAAASPARSEAATSVAPNLPAALVADLRRAEPESVEAVRPTAEPARISASSASPSAGPTLPSEEPDAAAAQLGREVAKLRETRAALAAGDARAALRSLAAYSHEFRAGTLAMEAAALRVEATASLGQRVLARELALDFERRYPSSPLSARVRTFAETTTPNEQKR
jgi:hypothetical protein